MSSKVSRPFGVTIVFLLILLSGALLVLAGILRLFNRGDEATDSVLDAPLSRIWQQAENRMHTARGLLWWLADLRG